MEINWMQVAVSVLLALIGSTGFWSWLLARREKNDAKALLLRGIAHDIIVIRGTEYLNRGFVTADEYENLHDYLYVPYEKMGGNGSAKRIMDAVKELPLHK